MLALGLLVYSDCVFRGRMLFQRDLSLFFAGWMEAFARVVAAGSWPVWNPYPAYGQPMLATATAQILYPTTWLNLILPLSVYLTFFAVLHLMLAGLGGWALLRGLGASHRAGLLAGAAWAASGPVLSTVHMTNMYAAAAWMPWIGFLGHRTLVTRSRRLAVLWGCAIALTVLAGSMEVTLMGLALVPACAGDLTLRRSVRERPGRTVLLLAIAAVLALLLSAAQWMPTVDWLQHSRRADLEEMTRRFWPNHPFMLAQTVLPLSLDPLPLSHAARQLLFDGREPLLYSIYMGGPLLALALAGAWFGGRHRAGFLALVVLGVLLSFGHLTPLYDVALTILPPLKAFRFPSKATLLAGMAVAVLAGLGVDAWSGRRRGSRAAWLLGIALPLGLLAVIAWHLASPLAPVWRAFVGLPLDGGGYERYPEFMRMSRHLLVAGLFLWMACAAIVVRAVRVGPAPLLAALAAVVGVGDLVLHTRDLNPTVTRMLERHRPDILAQIPRERPNRTLVVIYNDPRIVRLLPKDMDVWPIDLPHAVRALNLREYPRILGAGLWGIEGFPVDVPQLRESYAQVAAEALQIAPVLPAYPRLLRVLGVQYVISRHTANLDGLRLLSTVPAPSQEWPARLWALPDPLPRAYWVGRTTEGETPLDLVRRVVEDPLFDPRQEVLLPRDQLGPAEADSAPPEAGRAQILVLKPDAIEIETQATRDGYLVVTEAFTPGWRATVDERPAPILRANVVFRALRVPAGRHRVVMRYRPLAIPIGVGLSLLGLALAIAVWTRSRPEGATTSPAASPSGNEGTSPPPMS